MTWLIGLLGKVPGALVTKAAILGLVFTLGLSLGNHWATEAALQRELDNSAKRQAKNHGELIEWYAGKMKELRLAREQQEGAANAAYDILQRGKANADRAYRTAMSDIAKLRNENATLAADKSDPGCTMAPRMRDILDTAIERINLPSVSGSNAGQATAVPPRPYTTAPILTCGQLQRGFLNVLRAYGELKADVEAEVERQSRVQ